MAVALPFIAAAASAGGAILGGVAQARSAAYGAQVANNNAQIMRQNAAYSAGASAAQVETQGLKNRAMNAQARASIAANNIDVNTGSPADVQVGNRELGQLDTATVASRGAEKVYGYQTEATNQDAQATLDRSEVAPDIIGGVLKGVGAAAGSLSGQFGGAGGGGGGGGDVSEANAMNGDWGVASGGDAGPSWMQNWGNPTDPNAAGGIWD